jgi:phage anti-repressor protein
MKYFIWLILFYSFFASGCSYFDVEGCKKREYVLMMTETFLKKQNKIVDDYLILLDKVLSKEISGDELTDKSEVIRNAFIHNKKALETITPPKDYINEHKEFIIACQYCVDSADISLAALDEKDENVKTEKIKEAKDKIEEYGKILRDIRNRTSSR